MRSRILFEMLATESGLEIRIGEVRVGPRDRPNKGLACHVSNEGVPCEATTCTLKGGSYTYKPPIIDIKNSNV